MMERDTFLLGVDVGTSSLKIVLVSSDGAIAAEASAVYPTRFPKPGWAEQAPDDWAGALAKCLHLVVSENRGILQRVAGVGLTGQMISLVVTDAEGKPTRPCILWHDQRCVEQVQALSEEQKARIRRTALTPVNTAYTIPRLRWIKDHEPAVYEKSTHAMWAKDFLRFSLTGEPATDCSDASGSLAFDSRQRRWSSELADIWGIDMDRLPPVMESNTIVAGVSNKAARRYGLRPGIPVIAGCGDVLAENVAAGNVASTDRLLRFGSGGSVSALTKTVPSDADQYCPLYCHAVPGAWLWESSTHGFGTSLAWAAAMLGIGTVAELIEVAGSSPPGANGVLFQPPIQGPPNFDPDFRGAFFGFAPSHSRSDLARSVLEGTSCSFAEAYELLDRAMDLTEANRRERTHYAVGAGVRSELLASVVAHLAGAGLTILSGAEPAVGAAVLAGTACGIFPSLSEGAPRSRRILRIQRVSDSEIDTYHRLYERFLTSKTAVRALAKLAWQKY